MNKFTLGIDIGATEIKANIFDSSLTPLLPSSLRAPTAAHRGAEHAVQTIHSLATHAVNQLGTTSAEIFNIGIATPGPFDYQRGAYRSSPNLPGWDGFSLSTALSKLFSAKLSFINDASAAALAEYRLGAGKNHSSLLLLTVGTGIGGGYVEQRGLLSGSGSFSDFAAEFGHSFIEDPLAPNARICSCGGRGHLEAYASFTAMRQRVEAARDKHTAVELWNAWDSVADQGAMMIARANSGDAFFRELFCEAANKLGCALASFATIFAPELFVIGGGITAADDFYLDSVRHTYANLIPNSWAVLRDIPIQFAALGNEAGVIGAAADALLKAEK